MVALLGARQVGKTTLARQVAEGWPGGSVVFDLERAAVREALASTPERMLRRREGLVVIDEVQRVPTLFETLRPIADDPARTALFLLLGSASWDLIRGISETLAGRILFVDVGGFSLSEVGPAHQDRLWMRGGFPRAWLAPSDAAWTRWMRSFTRTFLERDIPGLGSRVAPEALGRFWRMLAHRHGQLWNASELATSMAISVTAVNHYRDLLAGSFMIRVLPPWFENVGKRLVKSPRIFLRDSGIVHSLLGIEDPEQLPMHPVYGASWEGFAIEQTLLAHGEHDAYFYRTQRGAELDLMLLRGGKRFGFEFKCSDAPRTTRSMHLVSDDLGLAHLWVIYPGRPGVPAEPAERPASRPCRSSRSPTSACKAAKPYQGTTVIFMRHPGFGEGGWPHRRLRQGSAPTLAAASAAGRRRHRHLSAPRTTAVVDATGVHLGSGAAPPDDSARRVRGRGQGSSPGRSQELCPRRTSGSIRSDETSAAASAPRSILTPTSRTNIYCNSALPRAPHYACSRPPKSPSESAVTAPAR